jgi:hypothetical protein
MPVHRCEPRRLRKRQAITLEKEKCEFPTKLRLVHFGRFQDVIWN